MKRVTKKKSSASAIAEPVVATTADRKLPVTERILQHSAARLISTRLVTVEVSYLQRTLNNSETEKTIDEAVLAVRKLPWSTIRVAD